MTKQECKEMVREIVSYSGTIDRMDRPENNEVGRDLTLWGILEFMIDLANKAIRIRRETQDCDDVEVGRWIGFSKAFNLYVKHKMSEEQLVEILEDI